MSQHKIITRSIGASSRPDKGIESVQEVETYLNFLSKQQGLELFATHYLGQVPGIDAFNVMFILKTGKKPKKEE